MRAATVELRNRVSVHDDVVSDAQGVSALPRACMCDSSGWKQ